MIPGADFCKTCIFWTEWSKGDVGRCHWTPAVPVDHGGLVEFVWSQTDDTAWCSHHQKEVPQE